MGRETSAEMAFETSEFEMPHLPHEILQVSEDAIEQDILEAFDQKMSAAYQKANGPGNIFAISDYEAEKKLLVEAKEELIKRLKSAADLPEDEIGANPEHSSFNSLQSDKMDAAHIENLLGVTLSDIKAAKKYSELARLISNFNNHFNKLEPRQASQFQRIADITVEGEDYRIFRIQQGSNNSLELQHLRTFAPEETVIVKRNGPEARIEKDWKLQTFFPKGSIRNNEIVTEDTRTVINAPGNVMKPITVAELRELNI